MSGPARFVRIYRAASPFEAHFVRGLLEREQITTRLVGENLSGGFGELPATVLEVEIHVTEQHAGRAREIIDAYEKRRAAGFRIHEETGSPWRCPNCHETIEASFEICWKCHSPRPEE